MSFRFRLQHPVQHCEDAVSYFLNRQNVKFTQTHLRKELLEHPDYPGMLAIADVIGASYNIASLALNIPLEQIRLEPDIKTPFLAQIKSQQGFPVFAVITKFDDSIVELYNPGSKKEEGLTLEAFGKLYLGNILVVEASEHSIEKGYENNFKEEKRIRITERFLTLGLPVITILMCLLVISENPVNTSLAPVIFTLLALAGSIVGVLLLWHEADEYNPALKQICQAGKKVNCSAILNSKASKVFGVSWSCIGFGYFIGMLMLSLTTGVTYAPTLQILSWLNVFALPYVGFSIYYQWRIAKQWCLLCLLVQSILLLQFVIAMIGGFHLLLPFSQIPSSLWLSATAVFVFAYIAVLVLLPAWQKVKESRRATIDLQRIKHNKQIFEALLVKQKAVEESTAGLGITVGKSNAPYKMLKVCNPYCAPCAKAHPVIDELIENNEDVQLQIIFTATESEDDYRGNPVRHLLAIASDDHEAKTKKALDDWYLAPQKDYEAFAIKYPIPASLNGINEQLSRQTQKIKAMREWCEAAQISFTPTFFISLPSTTGEQAITFYQLPEMYSIADLKYLLAI